MEKQDWMYIMGIVILVLTALLRYSQQLSEANFMQIWLLIIGVLVGGTVGYAIGKGR